MNNVNTSVALQSSAPGYSFNQLLSHLTNEQISSLLPLDALDLLSVLCPDASLTDIAVRLIDPSSAVQDTTMRSKIIRLLPDHKAKELTSRLGLGNAGELYTNLVDATQASSSIPELLSFFGVVNDAPLEDGLSLGLSPVDVKYSLYKHQRGTVNLLLKTLASDPRKALLHMPTGAGKTRTAIHVIANYLNVNEPTTVCWLAQSSELLEQFATQFSEAWSHLGNRKLDVVRFWGDSAADPLSLSDGVIVSGLAKMWHYSHQHRGALQKLGDRVSLTVIDEAHQAVASTYSDILVSLYSKRPRNALLGLTATPGRTWNDVDQDQRLSDFFDRKKVSLQVPDGILPVDYLVQEGYLAKPVIRSIGVNTNLSLSADESRQLSSVSEFPQWLLDRLGSDQQFSIHIIREAESLLKNHSRIIIFAPSVGSARLLSTLLTARNHTSHLITAKTPMSDRRRFIAHFLSKHQEKMFLCNYGVLTAGFDAPNTSAVLIARPTKSLVLYSQMAGRALRGPKAGGNPTAEIVTVADTNLAGFNSISDAFLNWEDVWRDE